MPMNMVRRLPRSRWALPMALAAVLLVLIINELAYHRASAALAVLDERVELRRDVQLLVRRISDAESGQRGFLLTGREEYLEPYERSLGSVRMLARNVAQGYAGDADAAPHLAAIVAAADAKMSEMETVLKLHREGRHETWQALLGTNIGKEQMDEVRSATDRLFALESSRIVAGRDGVADTLRISRLALNAMAVLGTLAMVLFLRQSRAFDKAQLRHAAELQTERDRLEREVELRTADLNELAHHLQSAREDERARLARELHDELGALLTAAKLDAARLKRSLGGPVTESEARLAHLSATVNQGIELKRRIIEDLRPSALATLGLAAALAILAREFAQRSEIAVDTELQELALDERSAIAVYRLVQESLTNIAKHAQARSVHIVLRQAGGAPAGVEVEVRDDGVGFDPGAVRGSQHGLLGMRHRVQALHGRLQLDSSPGGGTRLLAWLPLSG
ncbi:MAG: CHASE3 domain-containing protein [Rubrivivax sp.]|nr:CHASE3 domain-containing protein [Rubrivivax sp.]